MNQSYWLRCPVCGERSKTKVYADNVWYSLRSMMEEPGSHYQKAGWGAYQKDPPQRITAEPAQDAKDGQSEIYQIMDQAVELLERFESYSSRVQGELNLTSGQETFSANTDVKSSFRSKAIDRSCTVIRIVFTVLP